MNKSPPSLLLVSASHQSWSEFEQSALTASLRRAVTACPLRLCLLGCNAQGWPAGCSSTPAEATDEDWQVFVHDDVYLNDWMLGACLPEALAQFGAVGVPGIRVASRHK